MLKKISDNFKFIIYNLFIVILFISLSEFVLSYLLNNPTKIPKSFITSFRNFYKENDRSTVQVEPSCGVYDSELFYTLKPGSCIFSNREFTTRLEINQLGVRDDSQSLDYPKIVFTGDSFTMGWGVENNDTYVSKLENAIDAPILNAAISSYGTVRELQLLERVEIDSLNILIIQYHPNDYEENKKYYLNNNNLPISSEKIYNETSKQMLANRRYYFGKYSSQILKQIIKKYLKKDYVEVEPKENEAEYFLNSLLNTKLNLENVKILVFQLNNSNERNTNFLNSLKKEQKKEHYPSFIKSIEILDMEPHLSDDDYFILDNHLNAKGQNVVAQILIKHITDLQ